MKVVQMMLIAESGVTAKNHCRGSSAKAVALLKISKHGRIVTVVQTHDHAESVRDVNSTHRHVPSLENHFSPQISASVTNFECLVFL